MSEDYKVHEVWIKEAETTVLILEIPIIELEDKLAYLAREKGNIPKSYYEDFIIAACIANVNQLIFHIKQTQPDIIKVREELIKQIFKINPALKPSNLVINRNHVIKLKGKGKLGEDEKLLKDNKSWDVTTYNDMMSQIDEQAANEKTADKKETTKICKLEDIEFSVVKQWWKRINKYIEIKKFKEEDIASILNQRFFHNRSSFQTYVVSVCVIDSENLFMMLDSLGIPNSVPPPVLMLEVYELCREVNSFLTYENAQNFVENLERDDDNINNRSSTPNRMTSHASRYNNTKKKKQKKTFKEVPKEDLLTLADTMKIFVIGQDEAITNIVESIQRASVGLKDPIKPIGSFLFAGRTGCGKTLATKVLADELIKDKNNLITIDCSEYSADHEYSKLIGSPSGYIGHEQGGYLTNAINENPFSVVVFDEVEKASSKVHELLLQILEEGRLTDGRGQRVSFKDAIVILTSNIGVTEVESIKNTVGFGGVAEITEEKKTKAIDKALKKKFKPEFLNRLDSVVHFNTLSDKDYKRIVDIELYKLNDNLKHNDTEYKGIVLEFDNKIKNYVFENGIDKEYGARPLKRFIEKEIATPLASRLLKGDINIESTIKVSMKNKKIDFNIIESTNDIDKEKELHDFFSMQQ